jgi:UDP-N-acetylmuramyl pentapeptide phosphotransferase/UDP-N-acetylglucosamine-1-phosphate transferase
VRLTKSLLLAAVVLGLISFLAALKPPVAQYPVVEFRQQELAIRVLLQPLTGAAACQSAAQSMVRALTAACPTCTLTQAQCLIQLSQADSQALNRQARPHPTLVLKNGVMQFKSADLQQARLTCQETASTGIGRCLSASPSPTLGSSSPSASSTAAAPAAALVTPASAPTSSSSSSPPAAPTFALTPQAADPAPLITPLHLFSTAVALVLCLLIVVTTPLHARYTLDVPASGVQKFHEKPVPRVGGLAIFLGLIIGYGLLETSYAGPHAEGTQMLLKPMLFAALPAFAFGLAEDLTRSVGVAERLLATMASAVLAWWLTGVSLTQLDTPGLDALVAVLPLSVAFTAFAVGGVANAVNIIDGFHGLASGFFILACAAIGLIAVQVADPGLAQLAFLSAAVALGFFLVNYPFGRLFLGDGGAYLLGFWLAWLCVLLPMRNPEVSAWVSLLVCIYPVTEVLYSVYRRLALRLHMGEPDRAHLHTLLRRVFSDSSSSTAHSAQAPKSAVSTNALVAPGLWLFAAAPMVLAVLAFHKLSLVMLGCLASGLVYIGLYKVLSSRTRMRLQSA